MDDEGGFSIPPELLLAAEWKLPDSIEFRICDNSLEMRKVSDGEVPPETAAKP